VFVRCRWGGLRAILGLVTVTGLDEEIEMSWEPVALRAEVDYRVERALGDRLNAEHVRVIHDRQSWWQRRRAHADHHDESGGARAA
jgi:hypothetical protein